MILAPVLIKLTSSLEVLIEEDNRGVSSHSEVKLKTLGYLANFLDKAPKEEFVSLLKDKDHVILIGYNLNILCKISADDKSRQIRQKSLEAIQLLIKQLTALHKSEQDKGPCSIHPLILALPGVVSTLIKLVISDTKLPRSLLVVAIKVLADYLKACFMPCKHSSKLKQDELVTDGDMEGENLSQTCDNLAMRLQLLLNYTIDMDSLLPAEVKCGVLELCKTIVFDTRQELLSMMLKPLVKYIAFMSALGEQDSRLKVQNELDIMLIIEKVKTSIETSETNCDKLESVIMMTLVELLENLEKNYTTMLSSEKLSVISMFYGLLTMLPDGSLTTLFEISDKRDLIIRILIDLCQFAGDQPFLFLTDSQISEEAIESPTKIFSVQKRFSHLSAEEVIILRRCCLVLGSHIEWNILSDTLRSLMKQFESSSSLFVAELLLSGCSSRTRDSTGDKVSRFSAQMLIYYLEKLNDEYHIVSDHIEEYESIDSESTLKMVIAIETLVILLALHHKFSASEDEKTLLLKPFLCPILNWSSASSRAISEASLNGLSQVAHMHNFKSIKSLIEANIDYIVDGIGMMLNSYVLNPEITNVLALTLKLSSVELLYHFRDIYDKVFKLLGAYHNSYFSTPIALLFYRTIDILADWKIATDEGLEELEKPPLVDESDVKEIIEELNVQKRLEKLVEDMKRADQVKDEVDELLEKGADEDEVIREVKEGKMPNLSDANNQVEKDVISSEPEKSYHTILTERIIEHSVNLISSNYDETKVIAMKTASRGFCILRNDENVLLPLVHKVWAPLICRLTSDYSRNLEVNLCAFECLIAMAFQAKDFIKGRTLDSIIPRICTFLESQARLSIGQKDYSPYCMTMVYKCQLKILAHIGALAYHIQLAYSSLWRVVKVTLLYLDKNQNSSLRTAAYSSLLFMIALDADCVWYYAKVSEKLKELPFDRIYLAER